MSTLTTKEFFAFNTVNNISVYTDDSTLLDDVVKQCARYELLFSRTHPESQMVSINNAKGSPVAVDGELAEFIQTSLFYCEQSRGLYDVTLGSVVRTWNFKEGTIPKESLIAEALSHVDYRGVKVEGTTVQLVDPCACLDLGGIAKGYIADELVSLLKSRGVKSGIINLGGNVIVIGEKPDGAAWNVGIRMPQPSWLSGGETVFGTISVRDLSVVTSGIYERAFLHEGTLYHHILDPKTGYPVQTDLLSATIISEKSLDADGYTTALIIMGLDEALQFVEERSFLEAIFVAHDGNIYASSAVGKTIPFKNVSSS